MRLPESAALQLFNKYGIKYPDYFVGPPVDQDFLKKHQGKKFVVKANIPVGGKKKAGLVQFAVASNLNQVIADVSSKFKSLGLTDSVVVEEFIEHDKEYFLALKAVREGAEVYFSELGGIDVETSWDKVDKTLIPTEKLTGNNRNLVELEKLIGDRVITNWADRLIDFFQQQDATYLETNPFTVVGSQSTVVSLGVVLELDETAKFRHPNWPEDSLGSGLSSREVKVKEVDTQIKGSVKLVEVKNPEGEGDLTAIMGGGAGSVLFLCDAILENGFQLANYAEFSGNPPNWALTELTKEVCKIPGIENLVIGSGIANFTPASENIKAIIEGLRQSPKAKNLTIVVRRCGPGEEEGVKLMKQFVSESGLNIQVFDRYTGMTEIVSKLREKNG